jgi:hypothetical protein
MRSLRPFLATIVLLTACGSGGGSASVPSVDKGDMCILPAWSYVDARKCHKGPINLPVCFRQVPGGSAQDWMCMVSPSGRLYLYPSSLSQVFYYPGWSFGPRSRTKRQPAFEDTLSPKDEARCEEALAVRAQAGELSNPLLCVDPPGTLDLPLGTLSLTVQGMTFKPTIVAPAAWSAGPSWSIAAGALSPDPAFAAWRGQFFVRWRKQYPAPSSGGTYKCSEAEFWLPSATRPDDHTSGYHWIGGGPGPCPRPVSCQTTVTGVMSPEGYPLSGNFSIRNLTRDGAGCDDAVDLDGTFSVPYPEL